jgi:quercetin dioxygenase-like cupin family protein
VAHAGQVLEGPGGFRLQFVALGKDLLEMEATYAGDGGLPPEHLHPKQAEEFVVLAGRVRAIVAGAERVYEVGERFDVPAGTPHRMTGDGPARVRWQVRPALRTAEFAERLYGRKPSDWTPEAGREFLTEFSDEIRLTEIPPGQ